MKQYAKKKKEKEANKQKGLYELLLVIRNE